MQANVGRQRDFLEEVTTVGRDRQVAGGHGTGQLGFGGGEQGRD
jgi:hypothetical protein